MYNEKDKKLVNKMLTSLMRLVNYSAQPEWYLTQVLSWIRDHQEFLSTRIQPLLEKAGLQSVDAVVSALNPSLLSGFIFTVIVPGRWLNR